MISRFQRRRAAESFANSNELDQRVQEKSSASLGLASLIESQARRMRYDDVATVR